jgi:hypothetical protein
MPGGGEQYLFFPGSRAPQRLTSDPIEFLIGGSRLAGLEMREKASARGQLKTPWIRKPHDIPFGFARQMFCGIKAFIKTGEVSLRRWQDFDFEAVGSHS